MTLKGIWQKRYEIGTLIGEGLTSCVYSGYRVDHGLGVRAPVAFKVFKSQFKDQVLKNEIKKLMTLRSSYCVQLMDWVVLKQGRALVLELVNGVSLFDLMNNVDLSVETSLEILRQVQLGLRDIANEEFVHGDLTPKNIMIDQRGRVKLLDFGFSTIEGEKLNFATVEYLSPETREDGKVSLSSDIFSASKIFLEMLRFNIPSRYKSALAQNLGENSKSRDFLEIDDNRAAQDLLGQMVKGLQNTRNSVETVALPAHAGEPRKKRIQFTRLKLLLLMTLYITAPITTNSYHKTVHLGSAHKEVSLELRAHKWAQIELRDLRGRSLVNQFTPVKINLRQGVYQVFWKSANRQGKFIVNLKGNRRIIMK